MQLDLGRSLLLLGLAGLLVLAGCSSAPSNQLPTVPPAVATQSPAVPAPLPATPAVAAPPPTSAAVPAGSEPPAEVANTATRFFELLDAGDYAQAYRISLQIKWTEVGLQSYQSAGLMVENEFVAFFDDVAGVGGGNFNLNTLGVTFVAALPRERQVLTDYPELFVLGSLPAADRPLAVYEVRVGGTMTLPVDCDPRAWGKQVLVGEFNGQSRWRILLPGRLPGTLAIEASSYLTDDRQFQGMTLLG